VFLFCLLAVPTAGAVEPILEASLGATVFSLGAGARVAPGLKWSLWNDPDNILFADTFLKAEVGVELTPVYTRAVPRLIFSPLAVLELSVHYAGTAYFGTFNGLVPFDSPDAPYSEVFFDNSEPIPGSSHRVGGNATLQAQVGPVIVVLWGDAERWTATPFSGREGCCYFEPERELMFNWEETYIGTGGVALYEVVFNKELGQLLRVGNMTNYQTALGTGDELLRSGLLAAYSPDKHWTVALMAQPYFISRQWPDPFPPYIATQVRWVR
jgi:hypothetical protein